MSKDQEFVIIEFTWEDRPEIKIYFMGKTLEDILKEMKRLRWEFSNYREISLKEARKLGITYLETGIISMEKGTYRTYFLE